VDQYFSICIWKKKFLGGKYLSYMENIQLLRKIFIHRDKYLSYMKNMFSSWENYLSRRENIFPQEKFFYSGNTIFILRGKNIFKEG
jgi:hypothetical protein